MACDADNLAEKVTINVGGIRHTVPLSTLAKKPGTRLSCLAQVSPKRRRREYFFDRHPGVFNTVIDYYRGGELHVPLDVCGAVVRRELEFWKIDDCVIEPCCWTVYSTSIDNQSTLSAFNEGAEREQRELTAASQLTGWRKAQMQVWMVLDHPRSSRTAMAFAMTSFFFVLVSITGFCLETLPEMTTTEEVTRRCDADDSPAETVLIEEPHPVLKYIDYVCTAFFSVEFLVRVVFAPNKLLFFRSVMNMIDIAALLPLYLQIILELTDKQNCLKNDRAVLETIFILRIIRIFRIFHMVRNYKALTILLHSIRASRHELMMLSIFLLITMVVFATLVFYAESISELGKQGPFTNIPIGFWWSIVTMTTVGYGDITPVTVGGCVIGALCAIWGVLLVALTIPVISSNFALFYMHARTREQLVQQDRLRGQLCARNGRPRDVTESQTEVEMTRPLIDADTASSASSGDVAMVTRRGGFTPDCSPRSIDRDVSETKL
ncbi:hypothetical protein NP493_129g02003 [Ridgeia piscesae]|uniref:BTB domain-containing protein n=1 Tax=Ridgeia piscesae TaxID=27915 RepID=A0AAD9P5I0_RIDPI|nr:hypothetical protein NP493_129g02003 [Ridgeia piscesae]